MIFLTGNGLSILALGRLVKNTYMLFFEPYGQLLAPGESHSLKFQKLQENR